MPCLSLPHFNTLEKLYSSFGLENEFFPFLSQATCSFSNEQKHVILQMDEIHVNPVSRTRDTTYFGLVRTHFSEPEFIYYIDFYVISTRLVRAFFPLPGGVRTNRVLLYIIQGRQNYRIQYTCMSRYPTKTVIAIMVSSLQKKWSCIVRLLP